MFRCIAAAAIVLSASCLFAEEVTLASVPPVVVKTIPAAGSTKVSPGTSEIKVTFSKQMLDKTWSWAQLSDATFPEVGAAPKYLDDGRTCVLGVKLKPNKTYAIWVNSQRHRNFKDADGRSAVPYLLVFETGK